MKRQRLGVAPALAGALAARGVASLRLDKRGVGESGGDYLSTGFGRETGDAAAALAALRAAPGIDPARLTVAGHSAGAGGGCAIPARTSCGSTGGGSRPAGCGSTWPTTRPPTSPPRCAARCSRSPGPRTCRSSPGTWRAWSGLVGGPFEGEVPDDLTHLLRRHPGPPSLSTYKAQLREPVDAWLLDRVAA